MNIRLILVLAVLTVSGCATGSTLNPDTASPHSIQHAVKLTSAEALSIAKRFAEHDHFDFDRFEFKDVRVLQSSGRMLWFATWRRKGINDLIAPGDFPVVIVDDDTSQARWINQL